jgi:hypothetical protein
MILFSTFRQSIDYTLTSALLSAKLQHYLLTYLRLKQQPVLCSHLSILWPERPIAKSGLPILMELPSELRRVIYECVLASANENAIKDTLPSVYQRKTNNGALALTCVDRQL